MKRRVREIAREAGFSHVAQQKEVNMADLASYKLGIIISEALEK